MLVVQRAHAHYHNVIYTWLVSQCSNASLRINLWICNNISNKGTVVFLLPHLHSSHPLILLLSSPHSHSCSTKPSNSSLSTPAIPSIATYEISSYMYTMLNVYMALYIVPSSIHIDSGTDPNEGLFIHNLLCGMKEVSRHLFELRQNLDSLWELEMRH